MGSLMPADQKEIRETIQVYCRQRPSIESEEADELFITATPQEKPSSVLRAIGNGTITYLEATSNTEREFKFNGYFGNDASQQEVYETAARSIVRSVLEGYNGTIFAYGQTSAGKTYTMLGKEGQPGIIPRAVQDMLSFCDGVRLQISVSYLQIYCEMLTDLLSTTQRPLNIREKQGRVFVEGLNTYPVNSWQDCQRLLEEGNRNRVTASTRMNVQSSRSHAALMLHVTKRDDSSADTEQLHTTVQSTLFLVDLAGSERVDTASLTSYMRMEELKAINLSLSALGNCICALSEGRLHVPYRDAKLTRLLQGSLGGNARTSIIVAIKPGNDALGETLNTLKFAQRAARVAVAARITRTEDYEALYSAALSQLDEKDSLLRRAELSEAKLQEENESLRRALSEALSAKNQLQAQLATIQDGYQSSLQAIAGSFLGPIDHQNDMVKAIEDLNNSWRLKVDTARDQLQNELQTVKTQSDRQLDSIKRALATARQEATESEYQLTSEREAHLVTVKEFKKCHESLLVLERDTAARISELLSELESKRQELEQTEVVMKESKQHAEVAQRVASDLQTRVDHLEQWLQDQDFDKADYVHRDKVTEMENLFMETITRLNERVSLLEDGNRSDSRASKSTKSDMVRQPDPKVSRIEPGRVRASSKTQPSRR